MSKLLMAGDMVHLNSKRLAEAQGRKEAEDRRLAKLHDEQSELYLNAIADYMAKEGNVFYATMLADIIQNSDLAHMDGQLAYTVSSKLRALGYSTEVHKSKCESNVWNVLIYLPSGLVRPDPIPRFA